MPSIPQAFLCFREFINFYKSHGFILSQVKSSQAKVFLRPTISRTVCPGVRDPFPIFLVFPLEFISRQLRVWYYRVPALTRGWVCTLHIPLKYTYNRN
jgi:hypothetical protein